MSEQHIRRTYMSRYGFMGIWWEPDRGMFRAVINYGGKRYRLGRFKTARAAAQAYDNKARELRGDEAYLNFPKQEEKKVIPSQLHVFCCPEGHPYEVHGKRRINGGLLCRVCNREAGRRYKKRQAQFRMAQPRPGPVP